MNIVVMGSIGRLPLGGHAWVDMQYLLGFAALGHDVYYVEDCGDGSYVYDWDRQELTTSLDYPADYVRQALDPIGLQGRWTYRAGHQAVGMSPDEAAAVCAQADVLLIRAVPLATWRPEYLAARQRVFVDSDPGFTQISWLEGKPDLVETIGHSEVLFTIGQRLGEPDCLVPTGGRLWHRTRPPVALSHWAHSPQTSSAAFTTISQWKGFREVRHNGQVFGQKNMELPKYLDMPRRAGRPFRIALTGGPPDLFAEYGWTVLPGWEVTFDPWTYRDFIADSAGEFTVPKHGYLQMQAGWFSDRSVCYLASGRPVVVGDSGLRDWLPVGQGLEVFRNPDEAVAAVRRIDADYPRASNLARRLAEDHFNAESVLSDMLETLA